MKQKIIIMMVLMLAITGMLAAFCNAVETPRINVSLLNQDPDPAAPGKYAELRFKIFNNGAGTVAHDFEVMIDPKYPFTLDAGEEAVKSYGNLEAQGNGEYAIVVKYKVKVDENAVEGDMPITIKYRHDNTGWISRDFEVSIKTFDANLGIVFVETVPENLKPGDRATVNIKVRNMADSELKYITLKLDLTFSNFLSRLTTLSAADSITAFNAMPFAPLGSATEQKYYSLAPGQEKIFSYNLIAFSDAESKVYKVPIELTYYDGLETKYTKNDVIGLIVGNKPDMTVLIDTSDLYVGKKSGSVAVKIINKGFTGIKFLEVTAKKTDDFELLSPEKVYIGNVDSDDYETAEYNVFLNGDLKSEKTIVFPVSVEYRDANNNLYNDDYKLSLKILSPEKLGKSGGDNTGILIATIIVILILGVIIFRKISAKKK